MLHVNHFAARKNALKLIESFKTLIFDEFNEEDGTHTEEELIAMCIGYEKLEAASVYLALGLSRKGINAETE